MWHSFYIAVLLRVVSKLWLCLQPAIHTPKTIYFFCQLMMIFSVVIAVFKQCCAIFINANFHEIFFAVVFKKIIFLILISQASVDQVDRSHSQAFSGLWYPDMETQIQLQQTKSPSTSSNNKDKDETKCENKTYDKRFWMFNLFITYYPLAYVPVNMYMYRVFCLLCIVATSGPDWKKNIRLF